MSKKKKGKSHKNPAKVLTALAKLLLGIAALITAISQMFDR